MTSRELLPKTFEFDNLKLSMRVYEDKYFEDVYDLIQRTKSNSGGFSEDEYTTKDDLRKVIADGDMGTFHDLEADDKVIGFLVTYPTLLTRSTKPLYTSIVIVIDEKYRGNFVLLNMYNFLRELLVADGYLGVLTRSAVSSKFPLLANTMGWTMTDTIPNSLKIPGIGLVYSLILFFPVLITKEMDKIQKRMETEPVLVENKRNITTLLPADDLVQERTVTIKNHQKITIKGADSSHILDVENMIRKCAQDGFNLDEFCPKDGHYLHKFIHEPKVVIATDLCGSIKGAAISGFSHLSRTIGSLYSAYFIVNKQEQNKGIATALLDVVSEMCRKQDCGMLLFDVFVNNHVAVDWLHKCGFVCTGSIPHCGYIAGKGFTNSLLMSKKLDPNAGYEAASKLLIPLSVTGNK